MSRTYRRKHTPSWISRVIYGAHVNSVWIRGRVRVVEPYGQSQYDLAVEERNNIRREYHQDSNRFETRRSRIKECIRDRGCRSHTRQECQRVVKSGEYDTFDPSYMELIHRQASWVL